MLIHSLSILPKKTKNASFVAEYVKKLLTKLIIYVTMNCVKKITFLIKRGGRKI